MCEIILENDFREVLRRMKKCWSSGKDRFEIDFSLTVVCKLKDNPSLFY